MADSQEEFDLDLPQGLQRALCGAYRHVLDVPRRIDDAVVSAARRKFARRRQLKLWARWGTAVSGAAAAVIAVIVWLGPGRGGPAANQVVTKAPVRTAVKGDIDQSGQLDIVDAMALARHLRAGDATQSQWDVNGDATVDQRDVDALAAAAVDLKQRGLAERRLPSIDQLGLARLNKPNAATTVRAPPDFAMVKVGREGPQ
jgi:hypothetical protein